MIFISSSCVPGEKIKDVVETLAKNDFKNIELSGGTEYYESITEDLLELKEKYSLNFLCHNYFPPPKEHFVLNLASLNEKIFEKSITHLQNSIELSQKLGAKKFSFHAGFFMDFKTSKIGKSIEFQKIADKEKSIERFVSGYKLLESSTKNLKLYIENNVISKENFFNFKNQNPFMLTTYSDFQELRNYFNFNLLLDLAHLKVSCNSLKTNFKDNCKAMVGKTDYYHISGNNNEVDQNKTLLDDLELIEIINQLKLNGDITLEVYDTIDKIKESTTILNNIAVK